LVIKSNQKNFIFGQNIKFSTFLAWISINMSKSIKISKKSVFQRKKIFDQKFKFLQGLYPLPSSREHSVVHYIRICSAKSILDLDFKSRILSKMFAWTRYPVGFIKWVGGWLKKTIKTHFYENLWRIFSKKNTFFYIFKLFSKKSFFLSNFYYTPKL
jgi:hypothetical protein